MPSEWPAEWSARSGEVLDTIDAFAGSYWATLAIAAVGSYLGLFTVLRRIVFTGVALAQLAAAGVACAFFIAERPGLAPRTAELLHRHGPTVGSLLFSVLGMLGLQSKVARKQWTPDALVGLAYSAASALAILLVWRSAMGLVELKNILAGEVLLSSDRELLSLWVGLALVVGLHILHRRPFMLVSYDADFARAQGFHEEHYQRLLLGSLAVAVALSLKTAGLLLVFAVLVLPPLIGLAIGRTLRGAGLFAVASALTATLAGYSTAILADWPVAPSISLSLLVLLAVGALCGQVRWLAIPLQGALLVGAFAALGVAAQVFSFTGVKETLVGAQAAPIDPHGHGYGSAPAPRSEETQTRLDSTDAATRAEAVAGLGVDGSESDLEELLESFADEDASVREAATQAIAALIEQGHVLGKLRQIADGPEPELSLHATRMLMQLGYADGLWNGLQLLGREGISLLPRLDLLDALVQLSGDDFGYDGFGTPAENEEALRRWDGWWQDVRERVRHDPETGWSVAPDDESP